jgi:hypothetical protein
VHETCVDEMDNKNNSKSATSMSKHGHARTSEPTVAGPTVTSWRADIHAGLRNYSQVASLRYTAHSCGVSVCGYYINNPCAVHVFTPCVGLRTLSHREPTARHAAEAVRRLCWARHFCLCHVNRCLACAPLGLWADSDTVLDEPKQGLHR